VIQEPANGCPVGAAEYDPRANRWTAIAAPPMLKGQWAVTAAGGRQVVLVLNTGATYSWRPTTGRWQPLGTLPAARNHFSVAWTGSTFLVTRIYRWKAAGPGQAFRAHRPPVEAHARPAAAGDGTAGRRSRGQLQGAVYVLASMVVTHHTDQNGQLGDFEKARSKCCA
jgi:hypothetical protein